MTRPRGTEDARVAGADEDEDATTRARRRRGAARANDAGEDVRVAIAIVSSRGAVEANRRARRWGRGGTGWVAESLLEALPCPAPFYPNRISPGASRRGESTSRRR